MTDRLGPYVLGPNDEDDNYGIYTGDARLLAAAIPDESVDLILTSPPYDELREYKGYAFDFRAIAYHLVRVLKPGAIIVWIVADQTADGRESGTSFRQALQFMALGLSLHDTMIYEVAGTGAKGSHYCYWQAFEYMFVLSKGRPKTVNLLRDKVNIRVGATSGQTLRLNADGTRRPSEIYMTQQYGIRTNVWRYQVGNNGDDTTNHPAPFPEKLARDHILSWSNAGDIVLDPMIGSGTTCKAAKHLGRRWLGFDISTDYTERARERVRNTQPPLFTLAPEQLTLEAIP